MSIINYIKLALKNLFFGKEREYVGEYPEDDDTETYVLLEDPVDNLNENFNKSEELMSPQITNSSWYFSSTPCYYSSTIQTGISYHSDDISYITPFCYMWSENGKLKSLSSKKILHDTAILMPVANKIEPPVEEGLKQLEAMGFKVYRQTGYSAIDQARNRMLYYALYQYGHPSVLWIDSDVVFKVEDVLKTIERDLPVCAGAYPFKNPYTRQMTITMLNDEEIEFGSDKLVEIECAATGFLFIKKEVADAIIRKYEMPLCNTSFDQPCYPVFKPDFWTIKGDSYYLGEDYSFCMRARECGYKIMLDPSIKLGHIGSYVYSWEDVHYGHKTEVKNFKFRNYNHKNIS